MQLPLPLTQCKRLQALHWWDQAGLWKEQSSRSRASRTCELVCHWGLGIAALLQKTGNLVVQQEGIVFENQMWLKNEFKKRGLMKSWRSLFLYLLWRSFSSESFDLTICLISGVWRPRKFERSLLGSKLPFCQGPTCPLEASSLGCFRGHFRTWHGDWPCPLAGDAGSQPGREWVCGWLPGKELPQFPKGPHLFHPVGQPFYFRWRIKYLVE